MGKVGDYDKLLGAKISARRIALRLTQTEVAEFLGYSPSGLQKKEIAESRFSVADIILLCDVLRVNVTWFFSPDLLDGKEIFAVHPVNFNEDSSEDRLSEKTAKELLFVMEKLQQIYRI